MLNKEMNVENIILNDLKEYLTENSIFSPKVLPKSARGVSEFPTVLFRERSNANDLAHTSMDRTQVVNNINAVVEIYTQDKVVGNTKYASKNVSDELKFLIFDFFDAYGAERTGCDFAEYYNKEVDRLVITYSYSVNSWNRKIN